MPSSNSPPSSRQLNFTTRSAISTAGRTLPSALNASMSGALSSPPKIANLPIPCQAQSSHQLVHLNRQILRFDSFVDLPTIGPSDSSRVPSSASLCFSIGSFCLYSNSSSLRTILMLSQSRLGDLRTYIFLSPACRRFNIFHRLDAWRTLF